MAMLNTAKNANLEAFKLVALQQAVDAAETAAKDVEGYPAALTPVTVAQFLLESDWGRHGMGEANNYFGIKARPGEPSVMLATTEFEHGKPVQVQQPFRAYASMAECFADHARLICNRMSNGKKIYAAALATPDDPIAFANALTGVYATDPAYGQKLVSIMRSRGLLETFGFPDG
ncbi:MAG: glucosaminidase domain-containing protein [bacterium]